MPWHSRSPAETRALARALGESVEAEGLVVALSGPLGAGKTVFAKGVAEGLGLDPAWLASPTFVIAAELEVPGGPRLVHADLYRVEREEELEEAGLRDWLAPGTVLVVEWADRLPQALPKDRLEVRLEPGPGAEERRVVARAGGPASQAALSRWSERCP